MKCEKDYSSITSLKKHLAAEHMGKQYTCDKCGKSFSSKYTLLNHIKMEHYGTRITCERENCDASFKRRDQYRVHLLKHDGKALFTCVECGNFTIKSISGHTWILMQPTGSILTPNVAKCFCTVTMY